MKVRYIGDYYKIELIKGNVYEVIEITPNLKFYRIIDESGEAFDYSPEEFEIVEQ